MARLALLLLLSLACAPGLAAAQGGEATEQSTATEDRWGWNWIPPGGYYDDWVFLLLGYYSGLDGVGVGLEVSHPFTAGFLESLKVSDVELYAKGKLYEQFYGELEANADIALANPAWSIRAAFNHSTRLRQFWGIGPVLPEENEEVFRPRQMRVYSEFLRRFDHLRLGVRLELEDYKYLEVADGGLLASGAYPGVSPTGQTIVGAGFTWNYDTRDDRYNPSSGWWWQGFLMYFDHAGQDEPGFSNSFLDTRFYRALSEVDVLALQFFTYGVSDTAPVWRYASIGGREHTRGYTRNRYLDQRMIAAQAEWRRPLFWRLDSQLFGGVAFVSSDWETMQIKYPHPTFGAGLSVKVPEVSDVSMRGDLAFGDESLHGTLSIGYAF